jgi:hypothetical protein
VKRIVGNKIMKMRSITLLLIISAFFLSSTSFGDGFGTTDHKVAGLQASQMAGNDNPKKSDEKENLRERKENERLKLENYRLHVENIKLGLEKEVLSQNQKAYDSFLATVVIILTVFGILWTGVAVVVGIFGFKNLRDIRYHVKDEVEDIRRRAEDKLNAKVVDEVNKIIESIMKKTYEEPLNKSIARIDLLENYVKNLIKILQDKDIKAPEYLEKEEPTTTETKNIFD